MRIHLNTLIPAGSRPGVERLVHGYAPGAELCWRGDAGTRHVLGVEAGADGISEAAGGSIFASPTSGDLAVASVTGFLEERVRELLDPDVS